MSPRFFQRLGSRLSGTCSAAIYRSGRYFFFFRYNFMQSLKKGDMASIRVMNAE